MQVSNWFELNSLKMKNLVGKTLRLPLDAYINLGGGGGGGGGGAVQKATSHSSPPPSETLSHLPLPQP